MKPCSLCKEEKPFEEFYREPLTKKGYSSRCKRCVIRKAAESAAKDPERTRENKRRWDRKQGRPGSPRRAPRTPEESARARMRRVYGVTDEQIDTMTSCEFCGATEDLVWDHCHASGVTRGRLCRKCNTALGVLGDRVASIERVLDYLKKGGI